VAAYTRPRAFVLFPDLPKAGPLLAALTERDLAILVITSPPHWPAEKLAMAFMEVPGHPFAAVEEFAFVPDDDRLAILAQVGEWRERYDIVGTLATSEPFVEPAGVVADLLGLPGVGLRASRVCRNKLLQRLYLSRWSPPSVLAGPDSYERVMETLGGRFPVVTKPVDMFCSIGVQVLPDEVSLAAHLAGLAQTDSVLIEECVAGREYSVESIVAEGRLVFSSVTQKGTSEDDGEFVEMVHTIPAINLTRTEAAALKATQEQVIERLDFGTGMTHGEYRITPDGRVVLMEIAARPPGDGIMPLYHLATGSSPEAAVIDAALGLPVTYPEPVRWARQLYFEHQLGTLQDVSCQLAETTWLVDHGLWPSVEPVERTAAAGVRLLLAVKNRGDELTPITSSFGRAVTALFDGPTADSLDEFEGTLRKAVTIRSV
jgi:biotin carboxylase